MSNQANEDDDIVLRRILSKWAEKFNEMGEPNEGQDGWYITYDKYMDSFTKEVQSLIRTEKLKLLAEVRERVIGEKIAPNFDNEYGYCDNCEFQPTDGTRHCLCYYDEKLRKKQRAVLTKLEAEL